MSAHFTEKWDRHFLQLCLLHASMSKDPRTQVGAIIVGPDKEIRATGFNGLPRGILDSEERLLDRDLKLKLIVHAEINAVLNAARVGVPLRGCTMYLAATDETGERWGGPPCVRCSVELMQSGIERIVSYPVKSAPSRWKDDLEQARALLLEAGIDFQEVPV